MKAIAVPDVRGGLLAGAGSDELFAQTKPGAELHGRGLLGDEGVGAAFDKEAVLNGRGDLSAPVRRALDQGEVRYAALAQVICGCQSCDTAADDDSLAHGANTGRTKVVPLQDFTATLLGFVDRETGEVSTQDQDYGLAEGHAVTCVTAWL